MTNHPPRPKARPVGQPLVVDSERRRQLGASFDQHQDTDQARQYHAVRPRYPQQAVDAILALALTSAPSHAAHSHSAPSRPAHSHPAHSPDPEQTVPVIADLGAGTGILSLALRAAGATLHAVEPSASMLEVLSAQAEVTTGHTDLFLHQAAAEATGLPESSVDIAVAAQAWHWFDPQAMGTELRRILKPGGAVAVVGNYLDTSYPWVHRLTRIMRAGDVYRPQWQPDLDSHTFGPIHTEVFHHSRDLAVEDVFALAATLSSWLTADEKQIARRRENLTWYLYEHLGYAEGDTLTLPYITSLHTARRS